MLGSAGNRASAFFAYFFLDVRRRGTGMYILRLGRLRDDAFEVGCADQLRFALVPGSEDVCAGSTTQNTRVNLLKQY